MSSEYTIGETFSPLLWSEQVTNVHSRGPRASDWVQMVIENRDGPEEVRPFLIIKVLNAERGIVNGMLFLDDTDIRDANPGVMGLGMSQVIRSVGFEVPSYARGVYYIANVHYHPQGLQRQVTRMTEKQITEGGEPTFVLVEEGVFGNAGEPLLECTWRWSQ